MFTRRGNWQTALCLRRPRFLSGEFRSLPAPSSQQAKACCVDKAAVPKRHEACTHSPGVSGVDITNSFASQTVVLAAPSAKVVAMQAKPAVAAHETLRHALGTRDAYRILCALLRDQQASSGSLYTELEDLLSNVEGEAESLAAVACACVAVALKPLDWPPWVAARFVATGTAAVPFASNQSTIGSGRVVRVGEASKGKKGVVAAVSSLHVTATEILFRIASRLPSQSRCLSASSSSLSLLKWLVLLCGVTLAPSSRVALHLATEAGQVSLDAAGVALAAFCASRTLSAIRGSDEKDDSAADAVGHTQESWWLSLWMQLTQPSTQPPSLPPFSLDAVIASPAVWGWSDGLTSADLREKRVSWHLHCLIVSKEVYSAARLLAGACRDGSQALQGEAEAGLPASQSTSIPVLASTQAELLSTLPPHLLEEDGLGEHLAKSLLGHIRGVEPQSQRPRPWSGVPHSLLFVPTVTTNAVLYARMLQYLLNSATHVRSEDRYVHYLHDLSLLLSHGSIYALAASLVPAGQPLKTVMVATRDTHRECHMQQLVGALREVVDSLCGEPIPRLAALSSTGLPTKDGVASTPETPLLGSVVASDGAKSAKRSKEAHTAAGLKKKRLLLECATVPPMGTMSWCWREGVLSNVDSSVQAAVRLLTSLLQLCSSRRSSLPLRAAKPKWQMELHERTAVRAHKYELLLQELPHAELRAVLHTLLRHGYLREGGQLGVSLVKCEQVDLRYYTLPLLGSLYLAVSSPLFASTPAAHAADFSSSLPSSPASAKSFANAESVPESEREAVFRMYRRRLEVYGNADLHVATPSFPTTSDGCISSGECGGAHSDDVPASTRSGPDGSAAVTTTALVRTSENKLVQALVLASTRPAVSLEGCATAEFANCWLNRRVAVPGRGMVVDVGFASISSYCGEGGGSGAVFGPWHRTGVVTC